VWALAASVCLVGAMALMVDGAPAPARTTPAPGARVEANPQTRSPAARSLYGEGLQAYYDGDGESAHRLFRAALREDTTFAVAALYVAQTARSNEERLAMLARAVQLAERSGNDHERLLALATRAAVMDDPSRLAVAETLSIRYPHEPDGELLMGQALLWSGEFAAAIPRLRRVVAMEGAGPRTPEARCRACDALSDIQTAYSHLDSTAATVRTGREWVERQPKSAKAWIGLASALAIGGRHPEALDAIRRALALHAAPADIQVFPAELRVWAGEFEIADGLLRGLLRDGSPGQRREAAWVLAISLRSQGRLKEALALSEQLAPETRSLVRALLYREMGRHRESAALWEHRARTGTAYPVPPSRRAREWAWASTHRADALAGLGDTAALRALAPEIRRVGALSAYGRDRRLHHHARGLLLARQGRPHEAAAEFRRAQFSPVFGNTRTNLELGQALIAAGRPAEAIPVLRAALRAGVTATALYTTPTELRRVLGTAYDAAGQPDSAAAQYRLVQRAYRQADPQFAPYIAGITRRLGSAD
jgi:tetratricopeptide (TPR) repeat protein